MTALGPGLTLPAHIPFSPYRLISPVLGRHAPRGRGVALPSPLFPFDAQGQSKGVDRSASLSPLIHHPTLSFLSSFLSLLVFRPPPRTALARPHALLDRSSPAPRAGRLSLYVPSATSTELSLTFVNATQSLVRFHRAPSPPSFLAPSPLRLPLRSSPLRLHRSRAQHYAARPACLSP